MRIPTDRGRKQSASAVGDRWALRLPLLLATLALLLRVWAPGPMIATIDEPHWMMRSVAFNDALHDGDIAHLTADRGTEPATMPGITTVWAGAIGTEVARRRGGPVQQMADRMLEVSRDVVSFACALALWLSILLAAELVGRRAALVLGVLLAVEPWLVGHSHLLHTDAMVTMFGFASILALAVMAKRLEPPPQGPAEGGWVVPRALAVLAGVLAALALLTKLNAAVIIFGALAGITALRAAEIGRRSGDAGAWLRAWARVLGYWAGACAITCVLLWPALLVAPLQQVDRVRTALTLTSETSPGFYRGSVRTTPGPTYYPVVLALRMSPWLLGGTVLALAGSVVRRVRHKDPLAPAWFLGTALVVGVAYLVAIGASTKWYGRYALPLFPFAALASAIGVVATWDRLRDAVRAPSWAGPALVVAFTVATSALALRAAPHNIAYVDPLVGGQRRAVQEIRLGWGEGMEGADRIIERDAGGCTTPRVLVDLAYVYTVRCGEQMVSAPAGGPDPTYIVEYVSDRQQAGTARMLGRFRSRATLVDTVDVDGLPYVWVWRIAAPATPT